MLFISTLSMVIFIYGIHKLLSNMLFISNVHKCLSIVMFIRDEVIMYNDIC